MPTATRNRRTRMPQPAAPPAAPAPSTPANADATEWLSLVRDATGNGHDMAIEGVQDAIDLEKERAALQKRITDNRELLRLLDRTGKLTEAQAEFLDTFYPEKERGERRSKEDIEATRKAREAARKDGNA